ncbi:MAG: hypothetical protein U0228_20380 [Myxococcaceae bacterium]
MGLLPILAIATTLVPHTLRERAQQSDRVALVQVLSQRTERTADATFPLKTYTTVAVGTDLRGTGPAQLTIVQIGGSDGALTQIIPGDAQFRVGETAVVFVTCKLGPDRCHLVALGAGKLDVQGDTVFVPDLHTGAWSKKTLKELTAEVAVGVAR